MTKSSSSLRSYLLAAIVALGLAFVWALGVTTTIGAVQSATVSQGTYERLYLDQDGEAFMLKYLSNRILPPRVETLSGTPAQVDSRSLLSPMYVNPRSDSVAGTPFMSQWQWRLAGVNDGGVPVKYWYLVHDGRPSGRAYGIGYDVASKQVAGFFGRQGFTDRIPPRGDWFEVAGNEDLSQSTPNVVTWEPHGSEGHVLHFLADGKLWEADPVRRQVRALADAPAGATLGWAWDLSGGKEANPRDPYSVAWAPKILLVRFADGFTLVDTATNKVNKYDLPTEMRAAMIACQRLADGNLLLIAYANIDQRQDWTLAWLDPQGKELRRQSVRLPQQFGIPSGPATIGWMGAAAGPFVLGQLPTLLLLPLSLTVTGQTDSYWVAVSQTLGQTWPAILAVAAIGVAAAIAAYRRQRRFGLPHAAGWAVFAFLFGAPGWIAYRWHRTWPALEDCPACGHAVPHDRQRCTECLAPFPRPASKGIEVFA